jgi:alanyl-tRNA synthetase
MVQFKDVFLGKEVRGYTRAPPARSACAPAASTTTSTNVGAPAPPHVLRDARQLLVRRLLQGDAITYAWELLTGVYRTSPPTAW